MAPATGVRGGLGATGIGRRAMLREVQDKELFMSSPRIVAVEWAVLDGTRPRPAGSNARLGAHGSQLRMPILRLTAEDGAQGWGAFQSSVDRAAGLVGLRLDDLFAPEQGVAAAWLDFEYPIWDLVGQRAGSPVYAL